MVYDSVKFSVLHAHYPNKIFILINKIFMWFSRKDNHAAPWAGALWDKPFANKCLIFYRIILDSYGPYDKLLQHIGFTFPVSIAN